MASEEKYELLYREQSDVCGDPFPEFVNFAAMYPHKEASVLDLGCGQGRDAILFARHGFSVTGVDISPTGIGQMVAIGESEHLCITVEISDIRSYTTDSRFDVIILDRTLHMLPKPDERLEIIERCASWLNKSGHILIADERSNITEFAKWFRADRRHWHIAKGMKPGFCFAQMES